jgi:hypothetical protein
LEARRAADEAAEAVRLCERLEGEPPGPTDAPDDRAACGVVRARAGLIGAAMRTLADQNIDPAKDPQRAKEAVYRVLHPSRPGFKAR